MPSIPVSTLPATSQSLAYAEERMPNRKTTPNNKPIKRFMTPPFLSYCFKIFLDIQLLNNQTCKKFRGNFIFFEKKSPCDKFVTGGNLMGTG
jgi:hypothetical protein